MIVKTIIYIVIVFIVILVIQLRRNGATIRGNFQIIQKETLISSINKPYLKIALRYKEIEYKGVRFINDGEKFEKIDLCYRIGNILAIEGIVNEKFNSLKICKERLLDPNEYQLTDYGDPSTIDAMDLRETLINAMKSIENPFLKKFLYILFSDESTGRDFVRCPASINSHHNYLHGLLEHTVNMIVSFRKLDILYYNRAEIDRDLLITGIIIHDIGKIKVYEINNLFPVKKSEKSLSNHIIEGLELINRSIDKIDSFPIDLKRKLNHLILSHHGQKKWGAVVSPVFPEAELLHILDLLDYKYNELIVDPLKSNEVIYRYNDKNEISEEE